MPKIAKKAWEELSESLFELIDSKPPKSKGKLTDIACEKLCYGFLFDIFMAIWNYLRERSTHEKLNLKDRELLNFFRLMKSNVKCVELCQKMKGGVLELNKYRGLKELFSGSEGNGSRIDLFIGKCFEVLFAMQFSQKSWNLVFEIFSEKSTVESGGGNKKEIKYDCDLHDKLLNSVEDGYGSIEYFGWPLICTVRKDKENHRFVFCKAKVLLVCD